MNFFKDLKKRIGMVSLATVVIFTCIGISVSFASVTLNGTGLIGTANAGIDTAGILSIGTSSATAITIGSSGVATSFPGLVNIAYSSSTAYASFVAASTTSLSTGNLTIATSSSGCLGVSSSGVVYSTGCGTSVTTRTWSYVFGGTVQGGATGFALNLPSATAPSLTNAGGTVPIAVLEWPTGQSTYYAWATFLLPAGYTTNSSIAYSFEYRSADSSHAAVLTPSIACVGTSAALDNPTFGAGSTINLTASASSHQTITSGTWTPNTGSFPACSAGQRIWIKLLVNTSANSMTQPFDLVSATFSVTGSL